MGQESIYEVSYESNCPNCNSEIHISFDVSEYPSELLNFTKDNSQGVSVTGEPYFEYLEELYEASDVDVLTNPVAELLYAIKNDPEILDEIDDRKFEEIVAEIFRAKEFKVELTQRTRDGGKDIIAIHSDRLGIENKYFIECKHPEKKGKSIGVSVIRELYGVMNTIDGPNKAIAVTSSKFSPDAKKFAQEEARSTWDLDFAEREKLLNWIRDYDES